MAGVRRQRWSASDAEGALDRVSVTADRREHEAAPLVVEAVFELARSQDGY
jgi:3-hydroxyacyl-CoA dehydrogenase